MYSRAVRAWHNEKSGRTTPSRLAPFFWVDNARTRSRVPRAAGLMEQGTGPLARTPVAAASECNSGGSTGDTPNSYSHDRGYSHARWYNRNALAAGSP